jgi:hypothetical protein
LRFKIKLAVAFAVFGLLALTVFAVQWVYLSQPANTEGGAYVVDETFTAQSFLYGPQSWVPYNSKLPITPEVDPNSNGGFYVMFVDLNATSNLNATYPCVRVDYKLTGFQGNLAFHVYGYIKTNGGISWTNRASGDGASGYYIATQTAGSTSTLPNTQPMPDFNHVYVKVSNKAGAAFDDYGNNTYYLKFEKPGGGLNTLHITANPQNPTGNITTTGSLSGTFYVDFTGGQVQNDFVLLVAAQGTVGDAFQLNLKSSVPS